MPSRENIISFLWWDQMVYHVGRRKTMWRWFGGRQGRPGVPGGETGGVGLQLRLDLRLHLAPAVAKLASQALPASPAARPAPPRGPRGTSHRVDQCMVAHHHHHPPTTTLQLSLTDVWNEVWRRRIQHPPSGAGASWCVRLETSTVLPVHTS